MRNPRSGRNATRLARSDDYPSDGHERTQNALEERYCRLVENASETIAVLDEEKILFINAAGAKLAGVEDAEDLIGRPYLEFVPPDFRGLVRSRVLRAREGETAELIEGRLLRLDGSAVDVEATVIPITYGGKAATLSVIRDITGRKRAEEALAEERNLLRALIDGMPDFIFVKDAQSRFVINNVEHAHALGAPEEELVGKTDFDVFPRGLAERYYADEQEVVRSGRPLIDREEPITDSGGNDRWLSTTKVPLRDGEGRISGLVGISRDITERKALEEQLRHRAFHDPLTGLPNRALLLDRLEHALARSGRMGEQVAVLFVDLDDLKGVNDSLGHEMGNRLLVEVAGRLASCVRPGDTVARIFGDEFAVLLEAPTSMEDARRVAQRITERVRAPLVLDGREVFVSSSVGVVAGDPAREDRPKDVLRRADLAMYAAKSRGKDRSEVFNPSMDIRASERMELENDLRGAIEREEFEVHYQPLVDLRTGGIEGLEALVRWRHPERGLIAAKEFVRLAEETGLIRSVGRWVFEEACRQARRWNERFPNDRRLIVCVNFSASQFACRADLIPKVLADTGLDPRALAIEITEQDVMDDAELALGTLGRLKELGVSLGVDDYGAGYTCLRYLKLMPVDFLKIDRSFVAGLGEDPGDEAIVSGVINLAHALGLKVVAEGVETAEQLSKLQELNCDLAQGFHLYEPLPAGEVSDLLDRARR